MKENTGHKVSYKAFKKNAHTHKTQNTNQKPKTENRDLWREKRDLLGNQGCIRK